jgi:transcription antitermination factor NusG
MILTYGVTTQFGSQHWYMVELRSEKTIESTLRRMGEAVPNIFREHAVEVFVPLHRRDLNVFELKTGNYVFVRSKSFPALLRLKSITGVVGLVTEGESNRPSKAMTVEHSYVAALIAEARDSFFSRATKVQEGSFVRILDGLTRDWCGTVVTIQEGIAAVRVSLKTKLLLVETPVRNLLDLNSIPESLRTFYYSAILDPLLPEGMAGMLDEDLRFEEEHVASLDGLDAQQSTKLGRQQTVTALVKKLIFSGITNPQIIAREVLHALKKGVLKKPKNLSIVHGVIKTRLIQDFFQPQDATVQNYRDVLERFGDQYKLSIQDLVRLDPGTGLPANTPE